MTGDRLYRSMPDVQLRALRSQVGQVARDRIDAELRRRAGPAPASDPVTTQPATAPERRGVMNKTEAAYKAVLEARPDVTDVRFEEVKFRLASGAWYTPDFLVVRQPGEFEVHEVKGFWRTAARVRIKVAAARFHFWPFYVARKRKKAEGGGFDIERVVVRVP